MYMYVTGIHTLRYAYDVYQYLPLALRLQREGVSYPGYVYSTHTERERERGKERERERERGNIYTNYSTLQWSISI